MMTQFTDGYMRHPVHYLKNIHFSNPSSLRMVYDVQRSFNTETISLVD